MRRREMRREKKREKHEISRNDGVLKINNDVVEERSRNQRDKNLQSKSFGEIGIVEVIKALNFK